MYNDKYFYGITDLMHFNVYASLLKEHIIREERVIIKVFKKENEVVVVENNNFKDDFIRNFVTDSRWKWLIDGLGNTMIITFFSLLLGLAIGILIAIKGVLALLDALKKHKTTLLDVLFPVLTIIVGVMLAFGNGLDIMILIVGILLMVDGILGLLNALKK